METYTRIQSNGSKWIGEEPDSLSVLYKVLQKEPLDPTFEKYGNFIFPVNAGWRFWGNFAKYSHVFSIDTNDPVVIDNLIELITNNQNSKEYRELRR